MVVSEKDFNEFTGFAVVCPIIGEQKDFVFEVPLPDGFEVHGVILTDQFKSLDYTTRNVDIVGHADVNSDFMKLVMRNVQAILA